MKIVSIKSLGVRDTFSPEMASDRHNYITDRSPAVHANSHAVAYCLVAYRCLYLKAHFPAEWWAAVMSDCHPAKLVRYMGVAKSEGVKFQTFDVNNLTVDFGVHGDRVTNGLIGLKRVGRSAAEMFAGRCDAHDMDSFLVRKKAMQTAANAKASDKPKKQNAKKLKAKKAADVIKNKTVMERLIKLGAFSDFPGNGCRKSLWHWYLFKYCSGKDASELRRVVKAALVQRDGWTEDKVKAERHKLVLDYRALYPKRNVVPDKLLKWKPDPNPTRERVMSLFGEYTDHEILTFEKEYLGYYVSNPLMRYKSEVDCTFQVVSDRDGPGFGRVHAIVREVEFGKTKKDKEMCRVRLNDGCTDGLLLLWDDECEEYRPILKRAEEALTRGDPKQVKHELGVEVKVKFDPKRKSYTLWRPARNYGGYTRYSDEGTMRGPKIRPLPFAE